ncbi:uncharacterized protein LOC110238408 [Exaiptasia diaphana]|uniref:G-protein coupled receptors family 1 profile domain-containing protein n=1 Tax=Exaiptasia diaphana TaxID=2652724 RepID=A0A913X6T5_EXADI|nr:uncharacterized protein LOC110238408 [Exaiptasia diaphana]
MDVSRIVQVVLFAVQLLLTMFGNGFLLMLLWKLKQTRRSASMNFIFSCALADLTSAMINIPLAMDYMILKSGGLNGTVSPAVVIFMILFLIPLTFNSTLMIMVDRMLIVKCPVKYNNKMKVKKARIGIVFMWLTTLLFTGIINTSQMISDPPRVDDNPIEFMARLLKSGGSLRILLPICAIFLSSVAFTTMLYRGLQTLLKAKINSTTDNSAETLRAKTQRQMIASSSRTALIVMIIYLVSFFPAMIDALLRFFEVTLPISESNLAFVVLFFGQMSSFMNPYVFILRSTALRQAAIKFIVTNSRNDIVVPIHRIRR